ncbi:MAG: energy-coupling factor transporter ATPase [Candidatus Bathyarchaeia archaeon]
MGSEKIVEIKDVWFKYEYEENWALKELNFELKRGEFVLVTGPTGSGKTSLGLTIAGLIPNFIDGSFKGEVLIDGEPMTKKNFPELGLKVGIVWQNPENQLFGLSVEEEIVFGLENMALSNDEIQERLEWALQVVGMSEFLNKSPYELSGGQKQRVVIAAVLARRPEILVLDEPMAELDPQGRADVVKVIEELRKSEKISVVIIEHRMEELMEYIDRAMLMENGRISFEAESQRFFRDPESLKRKGVRPPQVIEFFNRINEFDKSILRIPITLDQASEALKKKLIEKSPSNILLKNESIIETKKIEREPIIEVESLSFIYPDGTKALTGIDLVIHNGDFVAIVGQNGSGKTTLVKHFNGLLKPTKGTVKVLGKDIRSLSIAELSRKVGYVSQNPDYQIFSRSVQEEIAFGPKNLNMSNEEIQERVQKVLDSIGISHLKEKNPIFLSRADKQKVVIASALAMDPQILVLDEPTNALDYKETQNLFELIQNLHRSGRTIILITHDMLLAAEYAEEIVVMSQGKIIAHDNPREIFKKTEVLKQASLKPPQITQLAMSLKEFGFPQNVLSVEEMVNLYKRLVV